MPPRPRPAPLLTLACALGLCLGAAAQTYVGLGVDFGGVLPRGVWADTYGPALVTALRLEGATEEGWVGSLQGQILYGNDVRVDPIAGLRTELGLLGDEGGSASPADVGLRARGFRLAAVAGYQRNFGQRPIGFRVLLGPAYTVHQVRIQDDAELTTSNLRDAYKRGYDRRAGGFGGYGEVALLLGPPDRRFVGFLAASANVYASRPLRSTQFDLQRQAPGAGTDLALGARLGFTTTLLRPASQSDAEDIYY